MFGEVHVGPAIFLVVPGRPGGEIVRPHPAADRRAERRLEHERERDERLKRRSERPRPLLSFFSWVFGPVVSLWSFAGMVPTLIYVGVGCAVVLVLLACGSLLLGFVRLFVGK